MPDPRRFKGRSDFLQSLVSGLVAAYGSDIGINPEFEEAEFIKNEQIGPTSPEQEKFLKSGAGNKPFKPQGFWAKGNAAAMNADYLGNRITAKGASGDRMAEMQFGHGLDIEKLLKEFELSKQKETQQHDLAVKRGDFGVVNSKGLASSRLNQYDTTTGDAAIQAALAGFNRDKDVSTEIGTKARIYNIIAEDTAGFNINTAVDQANVQRQLAAGGLERVDQVNENLGYDAEMYKRNAELNYINNRTSPMSPGSTMYDVTGKPLYTAPAAIESWMAQLNPGLAGQIGGEIPAAKAQSAGNKVIINDGRAIAKSNDTAPVKPIMAKPPLPEPTTGTVLEAPAMDPYNIIPKGRNTEAGKWVLENGRYVFKKDPFARIINIK